MTTLYLMPAAVVNVWSITQSPMIGIIQLAIVRVYVHVMRTWKGMH